MANEGLCTRVRPMPMLMAAADRIANPTRGIYNGGCYRRVDGYGETGGGGGRGEGGGGEAGFLPFYILQLSIYIDISGYDEVLHKRVPGLSSDALTIYHSNDNNNFFALQIVHAHKYLVRS